MSPTEPDLPRDPAGYRPKPLLGVGFWVMVAFGLVCVLAGVAVASVLAGVLQTVLLEWYTRGGGPNPSSEG